MNLRLNAKKFLVVIMAIFLNLSILFSIRRAILNLLGCKIGRGVTIHRGIKYFCFGGIFIGDNTTVNFGCYLDGRGGIFLGKNVNISHDVKIYTAGHNVKTCGADFFVKSVKIMDNAWIFPNALIMPGVTIGEGAVVYPGSVVVRDVENFSIVAGNPAKQVGIRPKDIAYVASFPIWFGV